MDSAINYLQQTPSPCAKRQYDMLFNTLPALAGPQSWPVTLVSIAETVSY